MAEDFNEIRKHARTTVEVPGWPANVRQISYSGVGLLGIDDENRLYWDGKLVKTARTIKFGWWEVTLAWLVMIGTMLQGIASFATWLNWLPLGKAM